MTKEERHNAILEQLIKTDAILVSDLSDRLAVSSVTIRKDLTELEKAGKLYRSHGKAIAINPFTGNRTVNEKEKLYPEEKYNIGMEAAKFIEPNDSIILASGTTIHAFAHCINPAHKLTVVSASLQAPSSSRRRTISTSFSWEACCVTAANQWWANIVKAFSTAARLANCSWALMVSTSISASPRPTCARHISTNR